MAKKVILVNEKDQEIGTMEKMEAHEKGVLHRAFSVFIMNDKKEMLLQKRAFSKYHSPGLWTNACCSHPAPGETTLASAGRRLNEEMGFDCVLTEIGSFTYKTTFSNNLTEHEFDHVLLGVYNGPINPDPCEVEEYKWISIEALNQELQKPEEFTFWFHLAYPLVTKYLDTLRQ